MRLISLIFVRDVTIVIFVFFYDCILTFHMFSINLKCVGGRFSWPFLGNESVLWWKRSCGKEKFKSSPITDINLVIIISFCTWKDNPIGETDTERCLRHILQCSLLFVSYTLITIVHCSFLYVYVTFMMYRLVFKTSVSDVNFSNMWFVNVFTFTYTSHLLFASGLRFLVL